jgi:hypothetical protein
MPYKYVTVSGPTVVGDTDVPTGEDLLLCLLPEPAEGWQGNRGGIQGPADAPLPAGDPPPKRLFLGKAEQGKTAYLPKILGEHIVGLRVSRLESHLRRRGILQGRLFRVGIFPDGITRSQSTQDIVIMCERWQSLITVVDRAKGQELVWCIRGEPGPPLQLLFMQSYHKCILLTLGSPDAMAGTQNPSGLATRVTSRPSQLVTYLRIREIAMVDASMHAKLMHPHGCIDWGVHQLHSRRNETRFDVAGLPSQGMVMQM